MTPKQFKEIRLKMGHTQENFGRLLGVTGRAIQYYESGQRKIRPAVVITVRMLVARSLMNNL